MLREEILENGREIVRLTEEKPRGYKKSVESLKMKGIARISEQRVLCNLLIEMED